jgi:hypothetical protein
VNTLPALLTRPPSSPHPVPVDQELDLAALLDLFSPEDPAVAPARRSLRSAAGRLLDGVQGWSERAARWGAVPAVPAGRSPLRTVEEGQ